MPKTLPRTRDYPMTQAEILTTANRMTSDARRQLAQADLLRSVATILSCACGGAITVPRRKDGGWNTEAAYVNHVMTCRSA